MALYYFLRWSILILLGLLIYGQTFHFDFVFDDKIFIVNNLNIRDFNQIHLTWHVIPMTRLVGIYSFALNYYFNGLHPQGYHIFNFIVHLVAVGLVWALATLLFKITKGTRTDTGSTTELPFIIAVLFLVHPCQTQAVSYITQRFESMATVFYLGTVYCYLRGRLSTENVEKIALFVLAGLLTLLGIMTKETVITVPAMIVASEWILFSKKNNRWLYIVLFVGWVLLYLLFTKLLHADLSSLLRSIPSESHDGDVFSPLQYCLTQMRVFLTFLRLLILPIHQNLDYDYPASTGLLHPPSTLLGLGVIAGIIYLIIKLRRSIPLIAFGLAWILITFSINFAPRANVIFEHKLYLISFGFFLASVTALSFLVRDRRAFLWIICGLVAVLTVVSFQRNKIWKNDFMLWGDTVRESPEKARANNNFGATLNYSLRSLQYFNNAIKIDPKFIDAYCNRGVFYEKHGDFVKAMADFTKAIEIKPDFADPYYNRALVFAKQNDLDGALADYNKAIKIDPDYVDSYINRGLIYAKQGKLGLAFSDFTKAVELYPNSEVAYNNLGIIYSYQGYFTQAVSNFILAIAINPKYSEAYWNRAIAYFHLKEYAKAWKDVNRAQELGYIVNPRFINDLKQASNGIK